MKMTVSDCLGFICFMSFRCNGTTVIAEIHRAIMSDVERYKSKASKFKFFYDFLFHTAKELMPDKSVGSCTEYRYTFNAGSDVGSTHWPDYEGEFLKIIHSFYEDKKTCGNRSSLNDKTREVIDFLQSTEDGSKNGKKRFKGTGPMTVPTFVDLCSLLGLFPLYCYTYSEVRGRDLGPAGLMRVCYGNETTKKWDSNYFDKVFRDLHKDVVKIWGGMITMAILENMLCELNRNYKRTVSALKLKKGEKQPYIDVITDEDKSVDSSFNDVYFYMHHRKSVQNAYCIRLSGNESSTLRPSLQMRDARNWNHPDNSKLTLTNWCQNKVDDRHLYWGDHGKGMKLDTKLNHSKKVEKIFKM